MAFLACMILVLLSLDISAGESEKTADGTGNGTQKIKALIEEGKYDDALSMLSPYIRNPLKHPRATSDYIVILVWKNNWDEAIELFEGLPSTFPFKAYLLRNVAKAYYETGRYSRAATLYEITLEKAPADREAMKGLVLSLNKKGEPERALEYLENLPLQDSRELQRIKARLLFEMGEYAEALRIYNRTGDEEDINREIEGLITSLSRDERAELLNRLEASGAPGDYISALVTLGEYKTAIEVLEEKGESLKQTDNLLSQAGWAYFKEGDTVKAKEYFNSVLKRNPRYFRAALGLSYCLGREGETAGALEILDGLPEEDIRVSFARAYVYEQAEMFLDAIKQYDRILQRHPGQKVALRLRLMALSDLGAPSLALEKAERMLPDEKDLQITFKGDMAVDRIRWKESEVARRILPLLLGDRSNRRARFDYIVALADSTEMKEAVKAYTELLDDGISPPPWVLENAAKAYLYLEEPEKALDLFNKALSQNPRSYTGRLGKFYTLQELRRFNEAREVLDVLDREEPDLYMLGKEQLPNWRKLEIAVVRGWMLGYEDRLDEAEKHFWKLREQAPANMGIRTGLAHIYLWRGWPRKALREFRIINTLEPDNVKARIGKLYSLDQVDYREAARKGAESLLKKYPRNKHVHQLVRQLEIGEMRELKGDFVYYRDEDGFEDILLRTELYQPLGLHTRAYGFFHWQKSLEDEAPGSFYYRRIGAGLEHRFNNRWHVRQHFSIDYDTGEDFGSYTEILYTPDDYWRLSLSYDSFSTEISLRARVAGIEASKLESAVTYRESEWREYGIALTYFNFSDGNDRLQGMINYEQGLYVKNNWKLRFFLELYSSTNSREDAPYFNPEYDISLSGTLMTEYTHWRIYNRAFLQKLFLTAGMYKQSGYDPAPIWALRYEHNYDFSDTQALVWGLTLARRVYDGEPVHSYAFYITYRGRF